MTGLQAWVGERLVPATEATVSVFDRGFRTGEGVFETFRSYRGHVFRLDDHLDRAFEGASILRFDPGDRDRIAGAVTATAEANLEAVGGGDAVLRLTLTPGRLAIDSPFPGDAEGGPTVVVTAHLLSIDPAVYDQGIVAATVATTRELPHVKALSYLASMVARAEARQRGAHEALLVAPDGSVLEGSSSNVFVVRRDRLVTPPLTDGILAGVTRAVVLELAPRAGLTPTEASLPLSTLIESDEVFLTATTREIVPIVRVDDTTIADGRPGPVTRSLHGLYRDAVAAESRG